MTHECTDRYVSFHGIDCDGNARMLLDFLRSHLHGSGSQSQWATYFFMKLEQRAALGQDDLFFVGSQINDLRTFFEDVGDRVALDLLEKVEEECC